MQQIFTKDIRIRKIINNKLWYYTEGNFTKSKVACLE